MTPSLLLAVLTLFGSFALASTARALEIGLDVSACESLSERRVRELTELELSAQVVAPRERVAALVSVTCAGSEVRIRVTDATTGKIVSRVFLLRAQEADIRARTVALAAAELLVASWMELTLAKPPEGARPTSPWLNENRRVARAIARERTERGVYADALLALAQTGGTFRARPGSFGAGLRVSLVCGEPRFGLDADFGLTFERAGTALGKVQANTWSLALRPALRLIRGRWLTSVGLGARAGLARIEGSPADASAIRGRVVAGVWGGPLLHANFGLGFTQLAARLGGEAGFALHGQTGSVDGRQRAGVLGPWFLLSLGLGWGA